MQADWNFGSVAIVGAGAVGLYYGSRLAAAGEQVSFLLRSDFSTVLRNGLRIESVHGDFTVPEVHACRSAEEIGPVDLVIIAWKSTANGQLAAVLPPLLHERTQVLTLQNGLGNCEEIAAITGGDRVLGGQCFVCINRLSPGYVRHTAGGRISIGEWQPGESGRVAVIASRFQAAGITAEAVPNLAETQWKKLLWNIPFNGLAITEGGVTTDVLLASPRIEEKIRGLMAEVVKAARAKGLALEDGLIDMNIDRTRPMGAYRPSSLIDFLESREVEIGAIWEEPLRQAKQAGLAMPRLEELVQRLHACIGSR